LKKTKAIQKSSTKATKAAQRTQRLGVDNALLGVLCAAFVAFVFKNVALVIFKKIRDDECLSFLTFT